MITVYLYYYPEKPDWVELYTSDNAHKVNEFVKMWSVFRGSSRIRVIEDLDRDEDSRRIKHHEGNAAQFKEIK